MSDEADSAPSRRGFLRTIAGASLGVPALGLPSLHTAGAEPSSRSPDAHPLPPCDRAPSSEITFPRRFTGRQLARISFPLGGIGTGCIGLGGRGNLTDWEIFNRPAPGYTPHYAFPALWVRVGDAAPTSVVLERRLLPPYDLNPRGLGSDNLPGMPRLDEATFYGAFPLARVEFHDRALPVHVALEAFSPFMPSDADASGLPCAVLSYAVTNPTRQAAEVAIAWSLENPTAVADNSKLGAPEDPPFTVDHRTNELRQSGRLHALMMTDPSLAADDPMHGSFVLAALVEGGARSSVLRHWGDNEWRKGIERLWFEHFSKTGELGDEIEPHSAMGSVALRQSVPAGEHRTFRFLLTWHFDNRTVERSNWLAPKGKEKTKLGNYYCTRFTDAWAVAQHVDEHLPELERATRDFVSALATSTLPPAVVEAASANLSTLVSNTNFRIADGSFHGFEGCGDAEGWGFGTCTHVWNYEVATQFLFPALARSMRDTKFGFATDGIGCMDTRHKLPLGAESYGFASADGQMGQIAKLFLDWRLSGDGQWLQQIWPGAKRALAFAWRHGGWDADKDGVMEGVQSNTYDVEFYGPNPMGQTWYLAALAASAQMATAVGDAEFAGECQRLYEAGRAWTDAHLFNGRFYIQDVRGFPESEIGERLRIGNRHIDTMHPDYQQGGGCFIDQLLGQFIADLAGLGPLLNEAHMRRALRSIHAYNSRSDLYRHPSVERAYAVNDEAMLVVCDYSQGGRPEMPVPYYSENWPGCEYAVAALMMNHGMLPEGVECIANVRTRYDGERANPYGETEYGRHYARSMASWAAIPILSGFRYDGVTNAVIAKPLVGAESTRFLWSAPTGWGTTHLVRTGTAARWQLEVRRGSLAVRSVEVAIPIHAPDRVALSAGGKRLPARIERTASGVQCRLEESVQVTPAAPLTLSSGG